MDQQKPLKASKNEIRTRVIYTLELMMNDISGSEIARILVDKYGISSRQASRYIYMANASLEEKEEINLNRKKAWYKARKLRALRDMDPREKKTANGVMTISKVYDSIAAMDGVVTKRVEVKGDRNNPIQVQHAHAHAHIHKAEIDYKNIPTELLELLLAQARGNRKLSENY